MTKKILVVDDEPDTRALVKAVLDVEGFETDEAEDGADALNKVKSKKYDLMLLDIMMPGLTPKEIIAGLSKIKNADHTKISYFSVVEFPSSEKKKLLSQKNVVDYIQKPFTNEDLVAKVKKILK